jgi:hypothetical protein
LSSNVFASTTIRVWSCSQTPKSYLHRLTATSLKDLYTCIDITKSNEQKRLICHSLTGAISSQILATMKVTEKGTNRVAEAHIYVEEQFQALKEYGEYMDPTDKAICSYVPVEVGDKIKIRGRFNGTVS